MSQPLSHADFEESLGAYALDAVDEPEAAMIDLHLKECPRCRDEVIRHRETAALLGQVGATAPPGLWDRIAGELTRVPPALALVRAPLPGPGFLGAGGHSAGEWGGSGLGVRGPVVGGPGPGGWVVGGPGEGGAAGGGSGVGGPVAGGPGPGGWVVGGPGEGGAAVGGSGVADLSGRRRRRRLIGIRGLACLVSAAAAVIGVLAFEVTSLQGQVSQIRQADGAGSITRLAAAALGTPGRETVTLRSGTDSRESASAVIVPGGQGYLIDVRLPRLASDKTYQLWALSGSNAISLGLLGDSPPPATFHVNLAELKALMITVEPAGGVSVPDNPLVISGAPVTD